MNIHNLIIYEFEELYKILVEIKKDINFKFELGNIKIFNCFEFKFINFTIKKEKEHQTNRNPLGSSFKRLLVLCKFVSF